MPLLTTSRRRAEGSPTARARALFKSHPKPTLSRVTPPPAVSAPPARRGSLSPSVASTSSSSSEASSSSSSSQGSIARLSPAEVEQLPLAHLRAAAAAAVDHAPRRRMAHVDVVLAEDRLFVRPPARRSHRWEDDWDNPPAADSGPSVLHGLIIVSSPDRRSVDDVVVSLTAHQSLALKRHVADDRLTGPPEENESTRELSLAAALDESRIELVKGVNCFAFEFHLPSTTPPSVCSSYGRLRYILRTALPGSSSLLKGRLSSRSEIVVVAVPPSREDAGELRFSAKRSVTAAWSGPEAHVVELEADQMILSAPLTIGLTLPAPPASLTILGLRSFVAQTVLMRSVDGEEQVVQSPRRLVGLRGRRQGWEKHADEWIAGVGKSAGDEEVVFDGRAWAARGGGEWKMELEGVVPKDNTVRPTTLSSSGGGSAPGLHFAAELVVEALVSPASGAPAEVVALWRGKVDLASAHCSAEALTLPAYAA